jgi:hypothetical protein
VKVRIGEDVPKSLGSPGFVAWLLNQRNVEKGGPVRYRADEVPAREDGCLVYRVPAGRLSLRFRIDPYAERAYGPLDLRPGGEIEIEYDFPAAGRARILLLDADGKTSEFGYVYDAEGGGEIADTDEEGRVVFGFAGEAKLAGPRRFRISVSEHADLLTGEIDVNPEREIVLSLERGGGVAGEIRRRDGSSATGALVGVVSKVGPYESIAVVDNSALFSLPDRLRTGRRKIEIRVGARPPIVREVVIEEGKVTEIAVVLPF